MKSNFSIPISALVTSDLSVVETKSIKLKYYSKKPFANKNKKNINKFRFVFSYSDDYLHSLCVSSFLNLICNYKNRGIK